MDFWRGEAYSKFFDHLESKGGFYYEVRLTSIPSGLVLMHCIAVGRRTRAQHRRGAVRAQGPNTLVQGHRIRARAIPALPARRRCVQGAELRLQSALELQ